MALSSYPDRGDRRNSNILKPEYFRSRIVDLTIRRDPDRPHHGHSRAFENAERGSKRALSPLGATNQRSIQGRLPCAALCVCFVIRLILGVLSFHVGSEGVITLRCEDVAGL